MQYDYAIEYNGVSSKSIGIEVVKRPNIPAAKRRYDTVTIPGRDGNLHRYDGAVEDIEIEIEFNFMAAPHEWNEKYRTAKVWLYDETEKRLKLGDHATFFYKVKMVEIGEAERVNWQIGKFSAVFICEGYQYLKDGIIKVDYTDILYNPYDVSKPIYAITGEGVCYLKVNGAQMKANVGQNLAIDTDLMIAYRTDRTIMNTSVDGAYSDLWLKKGNNKIEITKGFTLKVTPNWRSI